MNPTVTVLTTTYNRCDLLPRSMRSVLSQDYEDLELIVLDDCSTDGTAGIVESFSDPRIRYIRNETNQGSVDGDRVMVRRCVYELMRGRYFIYLCDDDFWLPKDLLSRQIAAFTRYPSLAMVVGGQAIVHPAPLKHLDQGNYYFQPVPEVSPTTYQLRNLFPSGFMTRYDYLKLFATDPLPRNILDGGTLFSRDAFIKAGVFKSSEGSRWQAGFEFKIGPALVGDVFYIDEPCVVAAIGSENASFRGTQRIHYLDSVKAVNIAIDCAAPALSPADYDFAMQVKKTAIHQITVGYFFNKIGYRLGWQKDASIDTTPMLTETLTIRLARRIFRENGIRFCRSSLMTAGLSIMPGWLLRSASAVFRGIDRLVNTFVPVRRRVHLALKEPPVEIKARR